MTRLAVCLLSCGRHDLTAQAVETFTTWNTAAIVRGDAVLLQADEPEMGNLSGQIGRSAGFACVHAPSRRGGQMAALRALVAIAQARSCSHVLWLENDWLTRAPIPWDVFPHFMTTRLFGAWKRLDHAHPRAKAGEHLLGTKTPQRWHADPDYPGWEWGTANWGAGGTIIRTDILAQHLNAYSLKEIMVRAGPLHTARSLYNIMHSVGDETTPGFIP